MMDPIPNRIYCFLLHNRNGKYVLVDAPDKHTAINIFKDSFPGKENPYMVDAEILEYFENFYVRDQIAWLNHKETKKKCKIPSGLLTTIELIQMMIIAAVILA